MTTPEIILFYPTFALLTYFLIMWVRKYSRLAFLIYLLLVSGLMLALFLAPIAQIDNQQLTNYRIFSKYNQGGFVFYYAPIMFLLYFANLLAGTSYFIKPSSKIYYLSFILMFAALLWVFTLGAWQQLSSLGKIDATAIGENIGIIMALHFDAALIITRIIQTESVSSKKKRIRKFAKYPKIV